jgi:hypothetical protein
MSILAHLFADRRERRAQAARDATVRAVLARAAADDEPPTLGAILARAAEAANEAHPVPSRRRNGAPFGFVR